MKEKKKRMIICRKIVKEGETVSFHGNWSLESLNVGCNKEDGWESEKIRGYKGWGGTVRRAILAGTGIGITERYPH